MNNSTSMVMSSIGKGSKNVAVVPTKETVDYDKIYHFSGDPGFGYFESNRPLKKSHIKSIYDAIQSEEQFYGKFIDVIRVDIGTMKVIDGQHRYAAYKRVFEEGGKADMKVRFEELPEEEKKKMDIVVNINSNLDNWSITAYNHRLEVEGNASMLNLKEFGTTHTLTQKTNAKGKVTGYYPRYVFAILLGRNATKDIKNGTISITKEQLAFGNKMHDELKKLVEALGYEQNSWFESFAFAWYNIRSNDKANSAIVDELGVDTICKYIFDQFNGWHLVSRKTDWEARFRAAIWNIKKGLETKTLN